MNGAIIQGGVDGIISFGTQIVVTRQLSPATHSSLRVLSKNVQAEDIRIFLAEMGDLKQPGEIDNINAVLQASVNANSSIYELVKEESNMKDALRILFKDELEEGFNKGIESLIEKMLRNGRTVDQIAEFCGVPIEEVQEVENNMLETASSK